MNIKSIITSIILLSGTAIFSSFQIFPTMLKIQVLDDTGNPHENVTVILYESEKDYKNEENIIDKEVTNDKGKVVFNKLDPKVYWIRAEKGAMDNANSGIKTNTLKKSRINKTNVIISGVPDVPTATEEMKEDDQ